MFDLAKRLGLLNRSIAVADVGAAEFTDSQELHTSLPAHLMMRFCFDASEQARNGLTRHEGTKVLPYALGDGSDGWLHLASGGMTSLLEPDLEHWKLFTLFHDPRFANIRTEAISTRRMDDLSELPQIDFLKIDVQGSELVILQNGKRKLADCSVVQIEVSFVPLYEGQPLFADLDIELRSQGFMVHGFASMKRLALAPYRGSRGLNQLIDLDMIYVRNIVQPSTLTEDQLRKTAVIVDACYGSFDLAFRCLIELQRRGACDQDLPDAYLGHISTQNRRVAIHHFPAPHG